MKGAKILLVDDEAIFTQNMARLLTGRGYIVLAANSGEEALAAMQTQSFDVVILDLKMPGIGGMETLRRIQDMGVFTQVLILTGHGDIESAVEATRLGAYDYLTKPCAVRELVAKIEAAWEKKDDAFQKDLEIRVQKAIESPKSVL